MRRPSPSLVISLIALFVALGGTSYAVTQLPRNSVGSAQIRAGAVTKGKLSRGAIRALSGKVGPQGATGATGAPGKDGAPGVNGLKGDKGDKGDPGPGTTLWAQVLADATLNAGSPGVTVRRIGSSTGAYYVDFGRDVSHCAVIGQMGQLPSFTFPGGGTGSSAGRMQVGVLSSHPTSTYPWGAPYGNVANVATYNTSNAATDSNFYIAAIC